MKRTCNDPCVNSVMIRRTTLFYHAEIAVEETVERGASEVDQGITSSGAVESARADVLRLPGTAWTHRPVSVGRTVVNRDEMLDVSEDGRAEMIRRITESSTTRGGRAGSVCRRYTAVH